MPSYEPGKKIWVILRGDREKANPPRFEAMSLSLREQLALTDEIEATEKLSRREAALELQVIAAKHVTGWVGLSREFASDAFIDVLNLDDIYQLLFSVVGGVEYEEKKS